MKIITDKNRDEIIEQYVNNLVDNMDWDALYELATESLMNSKDLMENEALESEILDYYPDLLEDTYENSKN